ncbi:MAG: ribosome-recycling factor [Patescibacteria group bacterium]|nr:ribosome-recycling factor [Patescibacteria group bacterium]MCL5224020.1 ribosome-recycling factor [Patescibacteria group bacterium]
MDYIKELEKKFAAAAAELKETLSSFRTNRPTPKLVENIKVPYLDQTMSVKQLGSITVEPPRDLVISVWDRNSLPAVAKAIESENIGLSVAPQGNVVRVRLPELTEERRHELEKLVKSSIEETRIKMRVERDAVNKNINAESDKDTKFRSKEEVQKLVDKFNGVIEVMLKDKLSEILS